MSKRLFTFLFAMLCGVIVFGQARYSVVIDELMADPSPVVGLPNAEWIELRNTTPATINLQGWRLVKPTGITGAFPAFLLQPDSCVIVCTAAQVAGLQAFGRCFPVTGFPALGNDGDLLWLQNAAGAVVHAVDYNISWYQNPLKAAGGWSLEMVDPKNPCSGMGNWKASRDVKGGTPGAINSVNGTAPDLVAPGLLRAFAPDSLTLKLFFDENLDSAAAVLPSSYSVNEGVGTPVAVSAQPPLFSIVTLRLATPLAAGRIYNVSATRVADCNGNSIGAVQSARVGLASPADSLSLIINELLFDPPDFGFDYLEIFNRSRKMIDLNAVYLANRSSSSGNIGSLTALTPANYLIFPGDYVAVSEDPLTVQKTFPVKNPGAFLPLAQMPSFPDDKGTAVLLNSAGAIIDEVPYSANWHFPLLAIKQGVALERIDTEASGRLADNWTSAAGSAGFGTPTAKNSQYRADLQPQGGVSVSPKLFSPDNDGNDDFALISFSFPQPGYQSNIVIYDAAGRQVRVLQRNASCALKGSFRWEGFDDKQRRVPPGIYIIVTDIFDLKGNKRQFKSTVAVAWRF